MPSLIVVGIQWGDEGKGKVVDLLSKNAQHVIRSQGGNNAGHTIVANGTEYRLHLIPSGIVYPHTRCYIAGGTAIDPGVLIKEIDGLISSGVSTHGRLFISPYAQLILPYHRELDRLLEKRRGKSSIGTTGKGIGPCYTDRSARVGIRMAEFVDEEIFYKRLQLLVPEKNEELEKLFAHSGFSTDSVFEEYRNYARRLKEYLVPVEIELDLALRRKEVLLFEGAHGSYLDVTFGTYPFVTSSNTLSGGVCAGAGIGPSRIDEVLGVVKAYTTRVGNGPFPTELTPLELSSFLDHTQAREIGTTTGRMRRIGWFDAALVRYSVGLNGVDSLAITKLDVLDHLSEIKICTGYRLGKEILKAPPVLTEQLAEVEPIYETLPGWEFSTTAARSVEDLPKQARAYLERLQELCGAPISLISLGPEREKTIFLRQFFKR